MKREKKEKIQIQIQFVPSFRNDSIPFHRPDNQTELPFHVFTKSVTPGPSVFYCLFFYPLAHFVKHNLPRQLFKSHKSYTVYMLLT